jgi:hypothetical protein
MKRHRRCLQLYIVLHIASHKSLLYQYLVHMPSSSYYHIADIGDFFHCTLLSVTDNSFHSDLQHISLCPRLLLYTAGSGLPYKQPVYATVGNSKQQFIIMLHSACIHIMHLVTLHYRMAVIQHNRLLSIDRTGDCSNSPTGFVSRFSPV